MRITAEMIERWADQHEARADLPVLVRRLIGQPTGVTALTIPGGAAVGRPGFDGAVEGAGGNAWVPAGSSRWEMGTGAQPKQKAADDYKKRTDEVDPALRSRTAFVFVTPRSWPGKQAWVDEVSRRGEWREVRAFDAVDLEHWLEQEAATALWFAEQLGNGGPGVHSIESWWRRWAEQTRPPLTQEAAFAARETPRAELAKRLEARPPLIGVRADSSEEAAAFACAVALSAGVTDAAVVSTPEAWRFVDAHPSISVVIAATPEIAAERAPSSGTTLVVPLGISDAAAQTRGAAVSVQEDAINLTRPHQHEFVDALVNIGVEPSDAERLGLATGRSWPVYRRLQAVNPALARPAWLNRQGAEVLAVVCLVGSWSAERAGDVAVVSAIAGREYEGVERDLRSFSSIDDAPLVSIGKVWKARSPLELLYLAGPSITTAQLDRFFDLALSVLSKPDPALTLEPDKRWAANIYGAARQESGLVINALCDGLTKLAVVGPRVERLQDEDLPGRAAKLVRRLLGEADAERWYSLSGVLPELAEAAPDVFLQAIEAGLRREDGGPLSLIRATGEGGPLAGGCHHAGLLWALERLAWNPALLPRVAGILARVSDEPIKGNWANSPFNSLVSLLRPWWPQTTATDEQRLKLVDRLRTTANDVVWRVMMTCVDARMGFASANAQPHWREDNAGAPGAGIYFRAYAYDLATRVLTDAAGRVDRIVELLGHMGSFGPEEQNQILTLADGSAHLEEHERETLRAGLRDYLIWVGRIDSGGDRQSQVARARDMLARLEPQDPIAAARWLFEKGWIELPRDDGGRDDDWRSRSDRVEQLRVAAVSDIFEARGLEGVDVLASVVGEPGLVGWALPQVVQDTVALADFVLGRGHPIEASTVDAQVVGALIRKLGPEQRRAVLAICADRLISREQGDQSLAALYALAPNDKAVWAVVDASPEPIQSAFWRQALPNQFIDEGDLVELTNRWLAAGRPRTALLSASFAIEKLEAKLLFDILDRIRRGEEPNGPMLDPYRLSEAFQRLDEDDELPAREVAMLQFPFFQALRGPHASGAKKLVREVLSDPALFTELITLVYKPRSGEAPPVDDSLTMAVENAWHVLRELEQLPGQSEDQVDMEAFVAFLRAARQQCAAADRAEVADSTLGGIFAHSPFGADGRWPHECVRMVLEQDDAEEVRSGFVIGIFNKRGVWSRSLEEGGAQERELSARYAGYAEALAIDAPVTAAALRSVADRYANDAAREDMETRLRIG